MVILAIVVIGLTPSYSQTEDCSKYLLDLSSAATDTTRDTAIRELTEPSEIAYLPRINLSSAVPANVRETAIQAISEEAARNTAIQAAAEHSKASCRELVVSQVIASLRAAPNEGIDNAIFVLQSLGVQPSLDIPVMFDDPSDSHKSVDEIMEAFLVANPTATQKEVIHFANQQLPHTGIVLQTYTKIRDGIKRVALFRDPKLRQKIGDYTWKMSTANMCETTDLAVLTPPRARSAVNLSYAGQPVYTRDLDVEVVHWVELRDTTWKRRLHSWKIGGDVRGISRDGKTIYLAQGMPLKHRVAGKHDFIPLAVDSEKFVFVDAFDDIGTQSVEDRGYLKVAKGGELLKEPPCQGKLIRAWGKAFHLVECCSCY